jgi:hypothetical protein
MLMLIDRAWVASVTTAAGALSYPATYRMTTAVIPIDLVNGVNRTAASQIAHYPTIAAVIRLGLGGDCKSKNGEDGEEEQDVFHDVVLGYRKFDGALFGLFKAAQNIFSLRSDR